MKTYVTQIWAELPGTRQIIDCRRFQAVDIEDLRSRLTVDIKPEGLTVLVICREAPEPPLVGQGELKF